MPEAKVDDDRPMYARISAQCENATNVEISVFGKIFEKGCVSRNHKQKAEVCVNEWNEHFDREWLQVRQTSATIMELFIVALGQEGVCEGTIKNALDRLGELAKG